MSSELKKVLVVDSEDFSRAQAQNYLEKLGTVVEIAHSGEEALRMIQAKLYNLVLIELDLFDMDGLNVAKRIKKMDSENKFTPMVALSNYSLRSVQRRAKDLGFHDYIVKPLSLALCKDILDKLFVWE
jgi:CheY-like chemotaxis protein